MKKLNLVVRNRVFYEGREYTIINLVDTENLTIEDIESSTKRVVSITELQEYSVSSEIDKDEIEYSKFRDKEWNEAKERLSIIKPLVGKSYDRTKKDVEEIAEKYDIHISTIYRWLKLYENSNLLSSLISKKSQRGGKDGVRIREESELIINKTIEELYLHKQKLAPNQIYFEIKRRCTNAKVDVPSENTVRNRIKNLEDKTLIATRESKRSADRLYRNTDGMFPEGTYPLDVIQIDHTPMDIIVVDDKYRQPIGRPYLTIAIDVYSRMVAGYYISLEEPSYFSVSQCMGNMICGKDKFLREYGVNGEWAIRGVPRAIHLDNAQEFKSASLQRVCEDIGISIEFRPVARPQFGGHIERLIGTHMREVHTLPGTTFSNIKERGEYNSDKEAAMTLYELERWMCEYIVNVYHKKIHSSLNMTPEKKYEIGIFGDDETLAKGLPPVISNEEYLKIMLLPTVERTIQQFGVIIDKIQYYSDSLRKWIKAKDKSGKAMKFIFKRDPRDISRIWFYDPLIRSYFEVPYRNMAFPPISIWELRIVRRYLEEKNIKDYDEIAIFSAYDKMNKLKEEAIKTTKTVRKQTSSKEAHERKKKLDFPQDSVKESSSLDDELFKNVKAFDEIKIDTREMEYKRSPYPEQKLYDDSEFMDKKDEDDNIPF